MTTLLCIATIMMRPCLLQIRYLSALPLLTTHYFSLITAFLIHRPGENLLTVNDGLRCLELFHIHLAQRPHRYQ
jgi:hypothetical protein